MNINKTIVLVLMCLFFTFSYSKEILQLTAKNVIVKNSWLPSLGYDGLEFSVLHN